MYSTWNPTQYSVMTYMGNESKKEWIYVYVLLIHYAVWQKLTNTTLQINYTPIKIV